MSYAVLFPGQGSQSVGMGADVFAERGDFGGEVLGWSVRDLCLQGPEEQLTRTDRAQPALYAVSYALWEEFRSRVAEPPAGGAGHSLGEYTALAASGAMDFVTGLRLVAARGAAMAAAASQEPSGMAALIRADLGTGEALAAACRDGGGRLWVANVNAPDQVVLAGGADDIDWAADHGRDFGVRRVVPLKVAGAFHSPFMAPAAGRLASVLGSADFRSPGFPVWANVTAEPYGDVAQLLLEQLTSPVRFSASLEAMAAAGITRFVHIGPGDVTAGLARRSIQDSETYVVSTIEEAAEVAAAIDG